jgi:hypothetical protein
MMAAAGLRSIGDILNFQRAVNEAAYAPYEFALKHAEAARAAQQPPKSISTVLPSGITEEMGWNPNTQQYDLPLGTTGRPTATLPQVQRMQRWDEASQRMVEDRTYLDKATGEIRTETVPIEAPEQPIYRTVPGVGLVAVDPNTKSVTPLVKEQPEAPTFDKALQSTTTLASRVIAQKYKNPSMTDWLAAALAQTISGKPVQIETSEQKDRWDEYWEIVRRHVSAAHPQYVNEINNYVDQMKGQAEQAKDLTKSVMGGTPTVKISLADIKKNPKRFKYFGEDASHVVYYDSQEKQYISFHK